MCSHGSVPCETHGLPIKVRLRSAMLAEARPGMNDLLAASV